MSISCGCLCNPIVFSTQVVVHREMRDLETEKIFFPNLEALAQIGKAPRSGLSAYSGFHQGVRPNPVSGITRMRAVGHDEGG